MVERHKRNTKKQQINVYTIHVPALQSRHSVFDGPCRPNSHVSQDVLSVFGVLPGSHIVHLSWPDLLVHPIGQSSHSRAIFINSREKRKK